MMITSHSVTTRKHPTGMYWVTKHELGPVARHVRELGRKVTIRAKLLAGVRTGRLKQSIRMVTNKRTGEEYSVLVGSSVGYALVHHEGARPHRITASPGKMLVFRGRRGRVVVTSVNHPGHAENKYLLNALTAVIR